MLNDVFADDLREREENKEEEEESFQDEVLPVATPVEIPSDSNNTTTTTNYSHRQQFDPFAPSPQRIEVDNFQDEDAPAGAAASGGGWDLLTGKSSGTFGSPVLIPSNPDADTDLLGGTLSKPASKATKDPKMKEITYQDDLMNVPNDADKDAEEEDKPDNFVDDEQPEGSSLGFFSRIRNRLPAPAATAGKPQSASAADEASPSTAHHSHQVGRLEDGGNSLPHPDSLRAGSTRDFIDEGSESGSEDGLDAEGNSLPHPDTLMRDEDKALLDDALRTSRTSDASGDDSGRDSSMDNARLMAALESASSTNSSGDEASEKDIYMDEDDEDANDPSVSESDSSRGRELDENGNSLPHPDDMIPYSSGHGGSSRWGSLRLGLKKAFSKSEIEVESDSDGEDGFADEEAKRRSQREDFDIYVSDVDREDEDGSYSSDEDSAIAAEGRNPRRKKPSLFQSLHEGMRSALRARKSKNQEEEEEEAITHNPQSREHYPDEEMAAFGLDNYAHNNANTNRNYDNESDDEDDFNDERKAGMSKKERLQAVVSEQWQNPRCRIPCIVLVFILLLLIILLPIVTRKKTEAIGSDGTDPNTATLPPVLNPDQVCEDEIFLTDQAGNDLVNGTVLSDTIACFTVSEPIHFRFKRCRPASPLDFVGVYPARSMFMNRLWGDFYDGTYLCGGQPCPLEEAVNQIGGPPRTKTTKAPPVQEPGEYRLFLVKDSDWPYELLKYTPSFQVVENKQLCPGRSDNVFAPDMEFNDLDLVDMEATVAPTTGTTTRASVYPSPFASALTSGPSSGTVSGTSTGISSGISTGISSSSTSGISTGISSSSTSEGRPDPIST